MGFLHYKIILILAFCNHTIMIVEHTEKSSVAIMITISTNIFFFRPRLIASLYIKKKQNNKNNKKTTIMQRFAEASY